MTSRHMFPARITPALIPRSDKVREAEALDKTPVLIAPIAVGFTEAEMKALARHLRSDMEWVPSDSDLIAARDAIFAAAEGIADGHA